MTPEIALYAMGILFLPFGGAMIYIVFALKKLVWQHDHPDQTGFGTVGMKAVIEHNTLVIQELIHYVRWLARQDEREPPPPISGS